MIRSINIPKHSHMLQLFHACLRCLKRFQSGNILYFLCLSPKESITICLYSCHLTASDWESIFHQEFRIVMAKIFPKLKQN